MRFDFSPCAKTAEEIAEVENIVNSQIKGSACKHESDVCREAKAGGALALFGEKYGESVKVYSIGDFSGSLRRSLMWSILGFWAV